MKKIILTLLMGLCTVSKADIYDFNLGVGLMNEAVGRYQTDVNGDKSLFNNKLALEAGASFPLDDDQAWRLHGDLGLLWPSGEVSYITRNVFYMTANLGYSFTKEFEWRLGGGFYFTRISGEGGTVPIQNGDSTTNFPIPEEASISRNVTLNTSFNYEFYQDVSVRTEAFVFNPLNSRNRTFNVALTLRYHFGEVL
ncbi:MAG: hypothetical protein VXV96_07940 [Bdellovibrionota bacterium]|nr:hypothetical protein [Bdellovibrionota bacterium]